MLPPSSSSSSSVSAVKTEAEIVFEKRLKLMDFMRSKDFTPACCPVSFERFDEQGYEPIMIVGPFNPNKPNQTVVETFGDKFLKDFFKVKQAIVHPIHLTALTAEQQKTTPKNAYMQFALSYPLERGKCPLSGKPVNHVVVLITSKGELIDGQYFDRDSLNEIQKGTGKGNGYLDKLKAKYDHIKSAADIFYASDLASNEFIAEQVKLLAKDGILTPQEVQEYEELKKSSFKYADAQKALTDRKPALAEKIMLALINKQPQADEDSKMSDIQHFDCLWRLAESAQSRGDFENMPRYLEEASRIKSVEQSDPVRYGFLLIKLGDCLRKKKGLKNLNKSMEHYEQAKTLLDQFITDEEKPNDDTCWAYYLYCMAVENTGFSKKAIKKHYEKDVSSKQKALKTAQEAEQALPQPFGWMQPSDELQAARAKVTAAQTALVKAQKQPIQAAKQAFKTAQREAGALIKDYKQEPSSNDITPYGRALKALAKAKLDYLRKEFSSAFGFLKQASNEVKEMKLLNLNDPNQVEFMRKLAVQTMIVCSELVEQYHDKIQPAKYETLNEFVFGHAEIVMAILRNSGIIASDSDLNQIKADIARVKGRDNITDQDFANYIANYQANDQFKVSYAAQINNGLQMLGQLKMMVDVIVNSFKEYVETAQQTSLHVIQQFIPNDRSLYYDCANAYILMGQFSHAFHAYNHALKFSKADYKSMRGLFCALARWGANPDAQQSNLLRNDNEVIENVRAILQKHINTIRQSPELRKEFFKDKKLYQTLDREFKAKAVASFTEFWNEILLMQKPEEEEKQAKKGKKKLGSGNPLFSFMTAGSSSSASSSGGNGKPLGYDPELFDPKKQIKGKGGKKDDSSANAGSSSSSSSSSNSHHQDDNDPSAGGSGGALGAFRYGKH